METQDILENPVEDQFSPPDNLSTKSKSNEPKKSSVFDTSKLTEIAEPSISPIQSQESIVENIALTTILQEPPSSYDPLINLVTLESSNHLKQTENISEEITKENLDDNQTDNISVMLFRPTVKSKGRPPKSSKAGIQFNKKSNQYSSKRKQTSEENTNSEENKKRRGQPSKSKDSATSTSNPDSNA